MCEWGEPLGVGEQGAGSLPGGQQGFGGCVSPLPVIIGGGDRRVGAHVGQRL